MADLEFNPVTATPNLGTSGVTTSSNVPAPSNPPTPPSVGGSSSAAPQMTPTPAQTASQDVTTASATPPTAPVTTPTPTPDATPTPTVPESDNGASTNADYASTLKSNQQDQLDTDQKALDDAKALQQANDQKFEDAYNNFSNTVNNISNGSIPLSTGEQAQVASLQQSYRALIDQQKLANTAASGLGNIRGYQTGAAEYDPTFQNKVIGSIVTAGFNKIADLNTKMAGAVAELTQSFQDKKISAAKDQWDAYQKLDQRRSDTIKSTIDDAQKQISDLAKQQQDAQKAQLDQQAADRKVGLDVLQAVSKFNAPPDVLAAVNKKINEGDIPGAITAAGKYLRDPKDIAEVDKLNADAAAALAADTTVNPDVLTGMLNVYKATGVLPAFGLSAKSPLRAQFYAALGADSSIVSDASSNKAIRAGLTTAYKTQQNQLSANETAINTLDKQLELAKSYSNKVNRSDSPLVNKYLIGVKTGVFGDPEAKALNSIVTSASYEFAKILSGASASVAGATVSSQADAENLLNSAMSKGQFNEVIGLMQKESQFRLQSQKDTLKQLQTDMNNVGDLSKSLQDNPPPTDSYLPPITKSYPDVGSLLKDLPQYTATVKQIDQQYPTWSDQDIIQYIQSTFNKAGSGANNAQTSMITAQKVATIQDGTKGGQCGHFVNNLTGLGLGDSYQSKLSKMNPSIKTPQPGMVFVMPYNTTGHTGIIMSVKNGVATVKDSNYSLDQKVKTHQIPVSKMTGFTYA